MVSARNPNDPVWSIYDERRTARLNVKYYCARVARLERWDFWLEFLLKATATGSAIAGLAFWQTNYGRTLWQILSVIAAIVAVAKPLLQIPEKIRGYDATIAGYRTLEHDLIEIERAIQLSGSYSIDAQNLFRAAMERLRNLKATDPEKVEDKKLLQKYVEEVNTELPADRFFLP
jgi:hypothetical protein